MSLHGSIKTMSVVDLLDWIDRRELRGTITLTYANLTRKLRVAYACATGAESDNPAEYLAQMLLNAGAVDEEELRGAFDARGERSLGKALLERGLVDEASLRAALESKIRESVHDSMSWDDGSFAFEPEEGSKERSEVSIALPLRDLVVSGESRAAEWRILRALIPSDAQRFWLPDPGVVERFSAESPDGALLRCVERDMTLREMVLERHSLPFPIYQRLADLVRGGAIRVDRRGTPRPAPTPAATASPGELADAARGRASGGDRAGALVLARQALAAAPGDAQVRKLYQELERALFAELSRALLKKYRVPKLAKRPEELQSLELTAEERYFVGRIDGRWDLLSLMRVSPLREVEALITIQGLADRGVITLE